MAATNAGSAGASFEAHLQSLRDFAAELRHQLGTLSTTKESVEALGAKRLLPGDFLEAGKLLSRHDEAVAQARALLRGIEAALRFSEQVTDVVATVYEREDRATAALYAGAARKA